MCPCFDKESQHINVQTAPTIAILIEKGEGLLELSNLLVCKLRGLCHGSGSDANTAVPVK